MDDETNIFRPMIRRLAQGATWNALGYAVGLAVTFIATPLILAGLGSEHYGLWVLCRTVIAGMAAGGLAMGAAGVKFVSESLGRRDPVGARRTLGAILTVNLITGLIGAVILWAASDLLASRLFRIDAADRILAARCFRLSALGWLVTRLAEPFVCVPLAWRRFGLSAILRSLEILLQTGAGLLILLTGGGLLGFVQGHLAGTAVMLVIHAAAAKVVFPTCPMLPEWRWRQTKAMLIFGGWKVAGTLGYTFFQWGDRFVLGILLSPAQVGYYNLAVMLAQRLLEGLTRIGAVLLPTVSRLASGVDRALLDRLIPTATLAVNLAVAAAFTTLFCVGRPFLIFWLGETVAVQVCPVLNVAVLGYMILGCNIVPHFVLLGLSRPKWIAFQEWGRGLLKLPVLLAAVPVLGPAGAALGVLLALPVDVILCEHYRRLIATGGQPLGRNWYRNLFGPALAGLVLIFLMQDWIWT